MIAKVTRSDIEQSGGKCAFYCSLLEPAEERLAGGNFRFSILEDKAKVDKHRLLYMLVDNLAK